MAKTKSPAPIDTTLGTQAYALAVQQEAAIDPAASAAMGTGGKATGTAKERHAAEVRMHEAVARIAGVGALAFATNATVRAQFAALKVKKKG
jgi:hypothetical protein